MLCSDDLLSSNMLYLFVFSGNLLCKATASKQNEMVAFIMKTPKENVGHLQILTRYQWSCYLWQQNLRRLHFPGIVRIHAFRSCSSCTYLIFSLKLNILSLSNSKKTYFCCISISIKSLCMNLSKKSMKSNFVNIILQLSRIDILTM